MKLGRLSVSEVLKILELRFLPTSSAGMLLLKRSIFISNLLESYILLYPEAWFQGVFLHLALCGKEQICICLVWIYVAFVKIYNSQKTVGFYLRILILGTTLDAYFYRCYLGTFFIIAKMAIL